MNVGLVTDVPNEFVLRSRKNNVQCQGQFHYAEIGAEVAAILGKLGDQLVAKFVRELQQLWLRQLLYVGWVIDHI